MEFSNNEKQALTSRARRRNSRRRHRTGGVSFSANLPIGVGGIYADSIFAAKCSEDPFMDFKTSILEMVEEVGVRDWEEMEELVHCYLLLNSSDVHDLIAEAFLSLCSSALLPSLAFSHSHVHRLD